MPSSPIEAYPRKDNTYIRPRTTKLSPSQHGDVPNTQAASGAQDVLPNLPSESLTHITSSLDPPDLFALAQTCKQLSAHVADDHTWRRAFAYQYLGITPESDLHGGSGSKTLILRREAGSWRKEFILRYNLRRRWELSGNQSITYIPHHSAVSAMHLMPNTTLLAASLQYGVVSRSHPLIGKILRGYLDASGTLNGLGIGNPNAEFSPHVSSVALASDGGTAKVLWGFRNGEVAVTTASRAMDPNRTLARLVRCSPGNSHAGTVECVAWAAGVEGGMFVSGGADGQVRVWEVNTSINCLWTSSPALVRDACVKVAMDARHGVVVAGLRSGTVLTWTGFSFSSADSNGALALEPQEHRLPAPTPPLDTSDSSSHEPPLPELMDICIAPEGEGASLLTIYHSSPVFHRYSWNAATNVFDHIVFGEESAASIRATFPVWTTRPDEHDFVITGDQLGDISIFAWNATPTSPSPQVSGSGGTNLASVRAIRRFAAHEDGAVTALAWNSTVLVSGSCGTIKAWDALTFVPLRTISFPVARPFAGRDLDSVSQIILEGDALVVSAGSTVLAWKAGPVGRPNGKGKIVRIRSGRSNNAVPKWQQQIEMYRDIAESCKELEEERKYTKRAVGRQKEHTSTLAHLGLSEAEALEYVLMLSRDEEEARRSRYAYGEDDGVFMPDFEEASTPMATPSNAFGSAASSAAPSRTSSFSAHSSGSGEQPSVFYGGRSLPRTVPSSSNHKVQVSPRMRPEPTEAGFSASPLASRSVSSSAGLPPPVLDASHFPIVAASRTSSGSAASDSSARSSAAGTPQSARSAWSTPLRSLHSSGVPSPSRVGGGGASPSRSPTQLSGAVAGVPRRPPAPTPVNVDDEDDEDLKFAIELSLAEARSRGEDV